MMWFLNVFGFILLLSYSALLFDFSSSGIVYRNPGIGGFWGFLCVFIFYIILLSANVLNLFTSSDNRFRVLLYALSIFNILVFCGLLFLLINADWWRDGLLR